MAVFTYSDVFVNHLVPIEGEGEGGVSLGLPRSRYHIPEERVSYRIIPRSRFHLDEEKNLQVEG